MALSMPNAADLFADADSPKKAAKSMDTYLDSLNKAMANPSTVPGQAPIDPVSQLEALAANKSLSPDAIGALQGALNAQRSISADIVKEITLTSPLSTSFAQFDLEVPAKNIAPRPTPLRNKIVRKRVWVRRTARSVLLVTRVLAPAVKETSSLALVSKPLTLSTHRFHLTVDLKFRTPLMTLFFLTTHTV